MVLFEGHGCGTNATVWQEITKKVLKSPYHGRKSGRPCGAAHSSESESLGELLWNGCQFLARTDKWTVSSEEAGVSGGECGVSYGRGQTKRGAG